ncbi:hypothetical protein PGB90_006765 [Kerria lacca]
MSKSIKENPNQLTFPKIHEQLQQIATQQPDEYLTDLKFLRNFVTEPFRGDSTKISDYLNEVHLAYELCEPSLRYKFFLILQTTVRGEPHERMREHPEEVTTYEKFMQFLKNNYEAQESFSTCLDLLQSASQTSNETCQEYSNRLTHLGYRALLASRVNQEIESNAASEIIRYTALRRFKLGSKSDISKYLLGNSLATDLTSATRYAVEFEQQINQSKKNTSVTPHNKYCTLCRTSTHNTIECRSKNKKSRNINECSYCRIPGHHASECRKKKAQENKINNIKKPECRYCKNIGHTVEECRKLKFRKQQDNEKKENNETSINDYKPKKINTLTHAKEETPIIKIKNLHLLIDTGAETSLIKYNKLTKDEKQLINEKHTEPINGVNGITEFTLGKTLIRFTHGDHTYEFGFSVLRPDTKFNIPFDGFLGFDIIRDTSASISKKYNEIIFEELELKMPIQYHHEIPPRTKYILTAQVSHDSDKEGELTNVESTSNIIIHDGIYKQTKNNNVQLLIQNNTESKQDLILPPIKLSTPQKILQITNEIKLTVDRKNELLKNLRINHLTSEEKKQLIKIIFEFHPIFYLKNDPLNSKISSFHEITTMPDQKPIFTKNYRFPEIYREEVSKQMKEYLKNDIIGESNSPWNSPVWIVSKKLDASGKQKWRIVNDYRKLNNITIEDKFPLPNIDDIFDRLANAKFFTTIDLASGFHQIPIHPKDIPKTAFSTHEGHYEFNRMPFGLINAPATFQRIMNQTLNGLIGNECFVYLDDIIIFSSSFNEHLLKLRIVFKRLHNNGLLIQLDKTEFLQQSVLYLGHTLSADGLSVQKAKTEKLISYPIPTDVKSL